MKISLNGKKKFGGKRKVGIDLKRNWILKIIILGLFINDVRCFLGRFLEGTLKIFLKF